MPWIFKRFKEPSTWAGLAGIIPSIAMVAADKNNPNAWGALVAGIAAVIIPEDSQPKS